MTPHIWLMQVPESSAERQQPPVLDPFERFRQPTSESFF